MKPVFLYVKQHTVSGLMYFGKTTRSDVVSYKGSGTFWRRHINKYGVESVRTVWVSEPFTDREDLIEFAQFFSECFDIVKSTKWANLVVENGVTGGAIRTGAVLTEDTKDKIRQKAIGRKASLETKEKMSKAHLGRPQTETQKQSMREYNLMRNLPELKCSHCNKVGGYVAMRRWHFDNCKLKEN